MGVCLHRIAGSKRLTVSSPSRLGRLLSTVLAGASCVHWVDNRPLFWLCGGASVCLTGQPGQMPSVMYHTSKHKAKRGAPMAGQVTTGHRIGLISVSRSVGRQWTQRDFKKLYLKVVQPPQQPPICVGGLPSTRRAKRKMRSFCRLRWLFEY